MSEDDIGTKKSIHYQEIKKDDTIDVVALFNSVVFGQSEFTNEYIITKIKKNIQLDVEITECLLENDMEVDDQETDDDDDITMNDSFLNRINDLGNLDEQFKMMCLE